MLVMDKKNPDVIEGKPPEVELGISPVYEWECNKKYCQFFEVCGGGLKATHEKWYNKNKEQCIVWYVENGKCIILWMALKVNNHTLWVA